MRALAIKPVTPSIGEMPPGCDIALLGKTELHEGRLDGFALRVLLSRSLEAALDREARATGKTRGEVLGYLLDLSLYTQR